MLEVIPEPFTQPRVDAILALFASPAWQDLKRHASGLIDASLISSINDKFNSEEYPNRAKSAHARLVDAEALRTFLEVVEMFEEKDHKFADIKVVSVPQAKE